MVVTFFISSDPKITASVLDDRRLGKQRVEAHQIINVLLANNGGGWSNHPCTLSWKDHIPALQDYYNCIVLEWIKRGKNNNMQLYTITEPIIYPDWCYNIKIHHSHQARLIQKMPDFYTCKFTDIPSYCLNYGYIWPCKWSTRELNTLKYSQLAEKFVQEYICNGIKGDGCRCSNKAVVDNKWCRIHNKLDYDEKILYLITNIINDFLFKNGINK